MATHGPGSTLGAVDVGGSRPTLGQTKEFKRDIVYPISYGGHSGAGVSQDFGRNFPRRQAFGGTVLRPTNCLVLLIRFLFFWAWPTIPVLWPTFSSTGRMISSP